MVKEKGNKPQLIAFCWSPDNAGIIKSWLNVDGECEWVQQADLPAGASIAISVENDLLTIKQSS